VLSLTMLAFAGLLAIGSPAALAQSVLTPGVHIDPSSPVAKEYAIPLGQARGGAGGGDGSDSQLFGSGITRAPSTHAAPSASRTAGGAKPHSRSPLRSRAQSVDQSSQTSAERVVQESLPARSGGGAGIAWMLGVAALVLALGGLGGAAIARYSRRTSTRTS